MSVQNTIFNSYPRPAVLDLPETLGEVSTSPSWFSRVRAALDTRSAPQAESRAESRLWDIVSSDPRVMAKLIQAPQRNDRESLSLHAQSGPAPRTVESAKPAVSASKAPQAQGLSVLLECVHQSRQRQQMAIASF